MRSLDLAVQFRQEIQQAKTQGQARWTHKVEGPLDKNFCNEVAKIAECFYYSSESDPVEFYRKL